MLIPVVLIILSVVFNILFDDAAQGIGGNAVNDTLLNFGGVLFYITYHIVLISVVLYPIWIYMTIKALRFNHKLV